MVGVTSSEGLIKHGQIARSIELMECLPTGEILGGDLCTYELKLDGYCTIAVKSGWKVTCTHATEQT
jgi:hypothetical protein